LVAIYSFSNSVRLLQDFTIEKSAAKRAVMRTRVAGGTALFDAIAQTVRSISARNGRKALVVFTDGADNSSVLDSQAAVGRAKRAGIPVFAVAQGLVDFHTSNEFVDFLHDVVGLCQPKQEIHVILDNLSAHKTHKVVSFLEDHPNVKLHFTPTYSTVHLVNPRRAPKHSL
jgi:hypothetical protein